MSRPKDFALEERIERLQDQLKDTHYKSGRIRIKREIERLNKMLGQSSIERR
jgi:hypothetical protein